MISARLELLSICALGLTFGCSENELDAESSNSPPIAARVNDSPILLSALDLYARSRIQKNAEDLTSSERETMLDELIRIRLLADAAETAELNNDPQVTAELGIQRDQFWLAVWHQIILSKTLSLKLNFD